MKWGSPKDEFLWALHDGISSGAIDHNTGRLLEQHHKEMQNKFIDYDAVQSERDKAIERGDNACVIGFSLFTLFIIISLIFSV